MNVKLTDKDKIKVNDSDDVYGIMQRILLRENKIDREKEHFWIIGINQALVILYIELVSMGSVKSVQVEPMNVFRVAILKGASRVIAIHNHPSNAMKPSNADKEITDKLIQVGKIIDIKLEDHLIISPNTYMSFKDIGLMDELEKSIKYVPTYQLIEQIRKEEKAVRVELERNHKETIGKYQQTIKNAIESLLEKELTIEQIATILNLSVKEVRQISKKK